MRFDPEKIEKEELFACGLGNIIAEVDAAKLEELEKTADNLDVDYRMIAEVIKEAAFVYNDVKISLEEALESWRGTLDKVFPYKASKDVSAVESPVYRADSVYVCRHKVARPCVFIPVFPGTNCEYDSLAAFERAGARVITQVFKNLRLSQRYLRTGRRKISGSLWKYLKRRSPGLRSSCSRAAFPPAMNRTAARSSLPRLFRMKR